MKPHSWLLLLLSGDVAVWNCNLMGSRGVSVHISVEGGAAQAYTNSYRSVFDVVANYSLAKEEEQVFCTAPIPFQW